MRTRLKFAKTWMEIAEKDIAGAKLMLVAGLPDLAHFHYHQASEKYLKSFSALNGLPIKPTTDLVEIIYKCTLFDESFSDFLNLKDARKITEISNKIRFPLDQGIEFLDSIDVNIAQKFSEEVKNVVLEKMADFESLIPPSE